MITKIDDHPITGADSLVATVRSYRPGDQVTVTYLRDGETATTTLELDSDAGSSAAGRPGRPCGTGPPRAGSGMDARIVPATAQTWPAVSR